MTTEHGHAPKEFHTERVSLEDICPTLYLATKVTLNTTEVGLFFASPLLGPEVTIPAIIGTSVAKAMTEDLPRFDILATQLTEGRYAEAFDGSLHYSRRIADSCLRQKAPQAVVHVAREIAELTHSWTRSLLDSKAR